MNLSALDLAIIGIPLALVFAIAFHMKRYARSVADFLAASRCAGRYLISTATGELGGSVMIMITMLEVFSKTGFSLRYWESLSGFVVFVFGLLGLVVYRYRETRALTFHQIFEIRFSKGIRVFSSFLNVFSGLFNFGIQPAVGARFFVYFCGLPDSCSMAGFRLPTFVPIMLFLMLMSVAFALAGGQISVIVTDCLEGLISMVLYLVIALFVIFSISVGQMQQALLSGTPGRSYVDPFDIGGRTDFNGWYVVIALVMSVYWYRGTGGSQGFISAARTAHEGRMATVLGNWRFYTSSSMSVLIAIAAFTVLHHPDFASQQVAVQHELQRIDSPQLVTQMTMPTALGVFFVPGIKGAFCLILLFGLLSSQGAQLLGYGATFLQDVVLPLRKKPFTREAHLWSLRISIIGVAIFACTFSLLFKAVDYLAMTIVLIGAIYLAGIGAITWGALYWKKATTAGAWAALTASLVLGVSFNAIQQLWPHFAHPLGAMLGTGPCGNYIMDNASRFPFNGQQLAFTAVIVAALSFVVVSRLTCRENFNLDRMLHRGQYRLSPDDPVTAGKSPFRTPLERFLQIDDHCTSRDRLLIFVTFGWSVLWNVVNLGIVLWLVIVGPLSSRWWFHYMMLTNVWMTLVIGVVVTIWFYFGVSRDFFDLLRSLEKARLVDTDDGTVRNHRNHDETRQS